ncbi:hypothetical protein R1flu_003718 [Riccia fluitans]|uniref:SAP domain-containing protein n=1 Tax=Riccia fluitans TaxID=41844 RepID=A0ABD1Y9T2_9MARC
MLQKRGLLLAGKKDTLIKRLSEALMVEAASDHAPPEKGDAEGCGQGEESVNNTHKNTRKEDSVHDGERVGFVGRRSLRSGKLVGDSLAVSTRSGIRSRRSRLAYTADDKFPSSSEKDNRTTPDSVRSGDVEVAGTVPVSKRVKRRLPTKTEVSNSGNEDFPNFFSVHSTRDVNEGALVSESQALKPGERNNFVKLNINGRGGGRRKFVNKTHFRRPGAYGRKGYRGKKSRRPAQDEADDALEHDILDEVQDAGASERKSLKSKKNKCSVSGQDAWVEADLSPSSIEDAKIDFPAGLSEALERVLHNPSNDNLLEVLELAFGFRSFRPGQLEAVKRVLALQSTMVMLPTGGGSLYVTSYLH